MVDNGKGLRSASVIAVGCVLVFGLAYSLYSLDGIRGAIFHTIFPDTSVYAVGYSDAAYRKVRIGDAQELVRSLLGEPIERDLIVGIERWRYSRSKSDSHYRMRQISFKNGRVVSKEHYYLVD